MNSDLTELKLQSLIEVTANLRELYDSLLSRLERGMNVVSGLQGKEKEGAERRYERLADIRQRIALALDVLEERAEVEERGSARGRCYLVILPEVEKP